MLLYAMMLCTVTANAVHCDSKCRDITHPDSAHVETVHSEGEDPEALSRV